MFRSAALPVGAGSVEDRLETLKRQFNPDEGGANVGGGGAPTNGLSMSLQDQYDEHEAEHQQAAKRHRGMGMGMPGGNAVGGDFSGVGVGNAAFGGAGAGVGGMGASIGGAAAMNGGMANVSGGAGTGAGASSAASNQGGAGGVGASTNAMGNGGLNSGSNPMGGANGPSGMNGMMNPMAGAAGGMNPMAGGAGMNGMAMNGMGMNGMNVGGMNMGGMNGAMNVNPMAGGMNGAMNPMNMNGAMNPMNMAAARAGMLGQMSGPGGAGAASSFPHLNAQGMPSALSSAMDNDIAAALYLNNFDGPGAGMGLLGQRGAGLGFAAMAQGGHLGGLLPSAAAAAGANPFGDYSRLAAAQNPYLAATGFPQAGAGAPGSAAANAAAMGGGAPLGLPGSNARRAQLMALMDMENELQQQQQEAAKVGSNSFPGAPNTASAGGAQDFMSTQRGTMNGLGGNAGVRGREPQDPDALASQAGPTEAPEPPMDIPTFSTASTPSVLPLPPVIEEGAAAHYSQRAHIPLGIDEDNNWLTEFQCFIRFDLIEVVQASRHVDQMNAASGGGKNSGGGGETFQQVGVRCRYCAHLHPGQRASRSSAFPSSIRQLYQSFTMMLRDHFEQCSEIPPLRKKLFSELKAKNSQGAYDSKQYWIYAAEKLGMIDSEHGMQMTAESQAKARRKPPFGTVGSTPHTHSPPKLLVSPDDIRITSDFLYTLMSQVQVVHLIDSERVGKRKTLRVGLPGFGCRYCCHVGRCGLSRMFPLRRRMLPGKVNEIYEHVKRCTLFPTKEKELLARLKSEDKTSPEQEKEFFDRIWERLGCESEVKK